MGSNLRLEWRLFEADYQDWDYTLGAIVTSCALTQIAAQPEAMDSLWAGALLAGKPQLAELPNGAAASAVTKHFSKERFNILTALIKQAPLLDDEQLGSIVERFFGRVTNGR